MIDEHYLMSIPELVELLCRTGVANKRKQLRDIRRRDVQ
jgi:hypothetical protein